VKVDIDRSRELADRYGVQKIPCVIAFKDGKPCGRSVGAASKAQLKALVQ
jgi:thioredoxin 1